MLECTLYENDARCGWANLQPLELNFFARKNFRVRSFQTHLWADNGLCRCQILEFAGMKKNIGRAALGAQCLSQKKCSITSYPQKVCLVRHIHSPTFFKTSHSFQAHDCPFRKKIPAKIRFAYHATAFLSSCKLNCQRMQKYGRYSTVNVATDENVDDIPGEYCNWLQRRKAVARVFWWMVSRDVWSTTTNTNCNIEKYSNLRN